MDGRDNNAIQPSPVVKWAGGKRNLLSVLDPLLPRDITLYCEPFVGGGAMLFHLQPQVAYVNDSNSDLISLYVTIRDDIDGLLDELHKPMYHNDPDSFLAVRALDRDPDKYASLTGVQKAARFIYLNKTCFNGLYRVNGQGFFNVPFGRYVNPDIINESGLRAVNRYFNSADIHFSSKDFSEVLENVDRETFVYLDPPYDPVSATAGFTAYTRNGFSKEDQIRLRDCCDELNAKGVRFMLSNADSAFVRDLYSGYNITTVTAKRSVSAVGTGRGRVTEVVVRNYK